MDAPIPNLSRRDALLAGAGVLSALAALGGSSARALARSQPASSDGNQPDGGRRHRHNADWRPVAEVFGQERTFSPATSC
jgi:hypothetical protein